MSDYTPTTEDVRKFWSTRQTFEHDWTIESARAVFDRWLAQRDGDIKAKVREQVAQEIEAELYAHGEEHAEGICPECDLVFAAAEIARGEQA